MEISIYWATLLPFAVLAGHIWGLNRAFGAQRYATRTLRKCATLGNTKQMLRMLDVMEGVRTVEQQRTFNDRLAAMDDGE